MQPGALNKRLTLERPNTGQDASGAPLTGFTTVGEVWARISPIKGNEAITADQTLATMDVRILIRHSQQLFDLGFNEKWRCVYGPLTFNIVSIAHVDYANRAVELMCKTGANAG